LQFFEIRSRQINDLLQSSDPNPYPHKFQVTYDANQFETDYGHLQSGDSDKTKEIRIAARIYNKRASGAKLIFYDVRTSADTQSIGVHIQVVCQAQEAQEGGVPFEKQHDPIRRGDVIGIVGYAGRTNPKNKVAKGEQGELSIFAREIILLAPCLHM
jgi:lysyl-tRNA synthetase, class II